MWWEGDMVPTKMGQLHYNVSFKKKFARKKCYLPEIIDREIGQSLSTCTRNESFIIRDDISSIRNGF